MPRRPEFLTDAQVDAAARKVLDLLPDGAAAFLAEHGIDPRDTIRFRAVAARCREARERLGLSLKAAAAEMRVPQYRLKAIEGGQLASVDPHVLGRWVARLELREWFGRWRAHNAQLAVRLGVPVADKSPRRRTPSTGAAVLQFRIELDDVAPAVWRRIQIPADASFWDLHVAIQDAMGWQDYHLHEFELCDAERAVPLRIGIPDDEFPEERPTLPGWRTRVEDHISRTGARVQYLYDFGDSWTHTVVFEGRKVPERGARYPRCMAGARACPPEDVGGPPGYEEFLAAIADPEHEQHDAMVQWSGGDFQPERFAPEAVQFSDPRARWRLAFGGSTSRATRR